MTDERIKVLYIAGVGRSGSTILGALLGQVEGFFFAGELGALFERVAERLCGCGEMVEECRLWREVFDAGERRLDLREILAQRGRWSPRLLAAAGAGRFERYEGCSFRVRGEGTFRGGEAARPFVGEAGVREVVEEWRLEVTLPARLRTGVMAALRRAHPYDEPAWDLYDLAGGPLETGLGLLVDLAEGDPDRLVRDVAAAGASGVALERSLAGARTLLLWPGAMPPGAPTVDPDEACWCAGLGPAGSRPRWVDAGAAFERILWTHVRTGLAPFLEPGMLEETSGA